MIAIFSAAALATTFTLVSSKDGCDLYTGPVQPDGTAQLQANCHWDDVDAGALESKLAKADQWHVYLDCLEDTKIVGTAGDRTIVWQRATIPGVATREGYVVMRTTPVGDGYRYAWEATGVTAGLSKGSVSPDRNEGYWQVTPSPKGGVDVVYEATYAPGGNLPLWIVRKYQPIAGRDVLADIHAVGRDDNG